MKKVILGSVLAAAAAISVNANAAGSAICSGGAAASASMASAATSFIKQGFKAQCSSNVLLDGEDNGTYYRVGSASVKGKNAYGGSTMGGAIAAFTTPCAATGCVVADVEAALATAASS